MRGVGLSNLRSPNWTAVLLCSPAGLGDVCTLLLQAHLINCTRGSHILRCYTC